MLDKEIFRKIKGIEIKTRRLVEDYFSGQYESVFKGTGMNFSDVREYQAGDDIRSIDWNVTARLGRPYVKQFVEERELTIMIVVDVSNSGRFGSKEKTKTETACEIASILAFSALKNQDKVGLIMFTEEPEKYLPPKKHRQYVMRIIREIICYRPVSQKTNIEKTLKFLNEVMKKKAIIFFISDFIDTNYEKLLTITNKKHDLIAITIGDEREEILPTIGLLELQDSETGARILINSNSRAFQRTFQQETEHRKDYRKTIFGKAKVDSIDIQANESYIKPLYTFFKMREGRK